MVTNGQLPPEQLLRGLEHPVRCVRDFSMRIQSTRPALMAGHSDRVLRSLERFGINDAFSNFGQVTAFECTEPVVRWLLEKSTAVFGLDRDRWSNFNQCWNWLASSDLPILKRYRDDIVVASNRWNESDLAFAYFATVVEDIEWRFRHECLPEQVRWEKAVSIVETLDVVERREQYDEFPEDLVDRTHALLRPKLILPESKQAALTAIGNSRSWEEAYWMNGLLITAIGLMGLDDPSAMEFLFQMLTDDVEYYNDSVASSLAHLGSQAFMVECKNRYLGRDYIARMSMMDVTDRAYAPWAADYCREMIALEDDVELRSWQAHSLSDQCMSQDVELLRALEEEDIGDGENIELNEKLKVLSVLFQDDFDAENPIFDEIEARKKTIRECPAALTTSGKCPHCRGYHSSDHDDLDDTHEFGELDGTVLNRKNKSATASVPGPTTVRNVVRVNRNSACPCGSGKKYKKCCMRK